MSDWLEKAIEAEKDELLQKLCSASPSPKEELLLELAAFDRLLARRWRMRELPPRPPTEQERRAVDAIMAILGRLPA